MWSIYSFRRWLLNRNLKMTESHLGEQCSQVQGAAGTRGASSIGSRNSEEADCGWSPRSKGTAAADDVTHFFFFFLSKNIPSSYNWVSFNSETSPLFCFHISTSLKLGCFLEWCNRHWPGGVCDTVVTSCLCANLVIPVHIIAHSAEWYVCLV